MIEVKRNHNNRWGLFTFIYAATNKEKIEVKVLSFGWFAVQKKKLIKKRE